MSDTHKEFSRLEAQVKVLADKVYGRVYGYDPTLSGGIDQAIEFLATKLRSLEERLPSQYHHDGWFKGIYSRLDKLEQNIEDVQSPWAQLTDARLAKLESQVAASEPWGMVAADNAEAITDVERRVDSVVRLLQSLTVGTAPVAHQPASGALEKQMMANGATPAARREISADYILYLLRVETPASGIRVDEDSSISWDGGDTVIWKMGSQPAGIHKIDGVIDLAAVAARINAFFSGETL